MRYGKPSGRGINPPLTCSSLPFPQVVAGVKRKREVLEQEQDDLLTAIKSTSSRARSPSVAMSMSPEPEAAAAMELDDTAHPPIVNNNTRPTEIVLSEERPIKRLRTEGPRTAGKVLGALAASAVAVCWALGKIGEMSTLEGI